MYDSYELSQQIIAHGVDNLDAAVKAYEEQMLQRSRKRVSQALTSLQVMFSPGAPETMIEAMMGGGDEEHGHVHHEMQSMA